MIGQTRLLTELARLMKRTRADGVSVSAQATTRRVLRFADGRIHQDLAQERVTITVKVIRDGRVGVASAETLVPEGLRRCVRAALEIARHSPQPRQLPPLPRGSRLRTRRDYAPATARTTAAACVAAIARLIQYSRGLGVELAGSFAIGEDELAVANSAGTACYAASTLTGAKLVTFYGRLSGFSSGVSHDLARLDLSELLRRSLRQSHHRREPVEVPLGEYEVILEPQAVADLLEWLGGIAFGAKSVEEHTSCLAGRMGERLMHPDLTIYDDGTEAGMLRAPFDFEGVPKQHVVLIDRGRAAGIVYDTTYGERFGQPSTGHALPPDETEGPLPLHLGIVPGDRPVDELIRGCRRGLLIPRFHYVNGLLHPPSALMTGLTREGACLIEEGAVTRPVQTLRFTQSILEAFQDVAGISRERRLVADPSTSIGCCLVPALHLKRFRFTGRSTA